LEIAGHIRDAGAAALLRMIADAWEKEELCRKMK
jgi:hypothetical protein